MLRSKFNTQSQNGYTGLFLEITTVIAVGFITLFTTPNLSVAAVSLFLAFTIRLVLIDSFMHYRFYQKHKSKSILITGAGRFTKRLFTWSPLIVTIIILINVFAVILLVVGMEFISAAPISSTRSITPNDYPIITTSVFLNVVFLPLLAKLRKEERITRHADPVVIIFSPLLSLCLLMATMLASADESASVIWISILMQLVFFFDFINKRSLYYLKILKLIRKVLEKI